MKTAIIASLLVFLVLDAPAEEALVFPGGTRNEVLHELTRAKLAELSAHASQVKQSDVKQEDGADQPATAVESKSEGNEKPKPESEVRHRIAPPVL